MADVTVDRRLYTDADGNLVEDGDPSAAFLWAAEGAEVTEEEAERVGFKAKKQPKNKAVTAPKSDKSDDTHVCDVCGFEAKTAGGLGAHQRSHEDED